MNTRLHFGLGVLYFLHLFLIQSKYECSCSTINTIPTADLERPGKNLCKNETTDCSNQIHNGESHASCLMRFFSRNAAECTDTAFEGKEGNTEEYGNVTLTPYAWSTDRFTYPALNITFANIKWKNLRMRFVEVGGTIPQACREFVVKPGDIDPTDVLSFDCLWYDKVLRGEAYTFQYVLITQNDYRLQYKYLFHMPKDSDVGSIDPNNYQLFLLMDHSAYPYVSLKLQVPPFETSNINITLCFKDEFDNKIIQLNNWQTDSWNKQKGNFITIEPFHTVHSAGYYYYNATFQSKFCSSRKGCLASSTPHLYIRGMRQTATVKHIQVIFITLLVFGSMGACLIWKYKSYIIIKQVEKSPNVLFVYESSYPSHIENIYKFKEFLKDYCCVAPKLDLIDIPKTETMNPWTWYYQAFEDADFVLIFASPNVDTEKGLHEDNVYHNLYAYSLRLLIVHLTNKHKFLAASVKLPGCTWDTLPRESITVIDQFSLPERLDELLKFLKVPSLQNGSSTLLSVLKQPRTPPQLYVTKPEVPLLLPFDAGNFDLEPFDDDALEPLSVGGIPVNLGLPPSSENDDDDEDIEETNHCNFNGLKM